jgi:capsular exopolysaccharide synthesis family protein
VELATWKMRPSFIAESFHATLASILFTGHNGDRPRVIVLTSANPREGKTTVASNLALAMADINQKVLLIDADMRRPRLHEVFSIQNDWGLSDLLLGKRPPEGTGLIATAHERLAVLPAGTETTGVSSLIHSPRMEELLKRMRQEFDAVLIDTPPMLQIPDARVLGKLADGVILVLRAGQTMRDAAHAATQRLMEDGSNVMGTVLNDWDAKKAGGYSYGYGYGDYYHRRDTPEEHGQAPNTEEK